MACDRLAIALLLCAATFHHPAKSHNSQLVHVADNDLEDAFVENQDAGGANSFVTDNEQFIATQEWQTIKQGQAIPKGLHVRINLETGEKEAKLLENEESNREEPITITTYHDKINPALEEALKNIATSQDEPSGNKEESGDIQEKKEFKTLDEIKSVFSKANITITSEMEIITKLHKNLMSDFSIEDLELSHLLNDLEFYLHTYDNAIYFADIGGLTSLAALFNQTTTSSAIKSDIALAIGAACQSNSYVAAKASQSGIIPLLLKQVMSVDDNSLSSSCVYAISAIVRALPDSWQSVAAHGGFDTFKNLIENKMGSLKVKVKVFTLLSDLLTVIESTTSENDKAQWIQTWQAMTKAGLLAPLVACSQASELLDHEQITDVFTEKLLEYLQSTCKLGICAPNEAIVRSLDLVQLRHSQHSKEDNDHHESIANLAQNVKLCITKKTTKDEL